MDPRNGEVLALGSYPSFDANLFAKPIDQETYERLNSEENGAPLFNRATSAAYPTGSTFKPVTAFAALADGTITPSTPLNDPGVFRYGGREFKNARDAVFGTLTLPRALTVSSDVFFYQLGARLNEDGPVLQEWARKLGFGHRTGIDLPGEFGGLVPDRKWRDSGFRAYERCRKQAKLPYQSQAALFACGGIDRGWSGGDNVNLAVGQGDLQATPLQLADGVRRDRQRRQGHHARTSASRWRTSTARSSSRSASRPGGASTSRAARSTPSAPACSARPPARAAPRPT